MNLILTLTFFSKQNNGKYHEMLMLVMGNILNGTSNVKKKETQFLWKPGGEKKKKKPR